MINFKTYFAKDLKREILELYASTTIKYFALSLISIFEPVYLYTLITYTVVFFAVPLGGKLAVRFGFEHCIFYSVPLLIIYYLILYSISFLPILFFIAPFFIAFHKILFWPAYHANFVYYGNKSRRAMEISSIKGLVYLVAIIGPIIGGIILTFFGFKIFFVYYCLFNIICFNYSFIYYFGKI
jgi:predicted MFS family arabinose efflux permease